VYDKNITSKNQQGRLLMDSIVKKLSEIESAASSIVEHAEAQKEILDKEYQEKRRLFDIESRTMSEIQKIRDRLETDTQNVLNGQSSDNNSATIALQKNYKERHSQYAQEILARITTV
jgi:hypothetical protein